MLWSPSSWLYDPTASLTPNCTVHVSETQILLQRMKIYDSGEGYSLRMGEFPQEGLEVVLSRIRTQPPQKGQYFPNCPFHKHSSTQISGI